MKRLSVIVPIFNEGDNIEELYLSLCRVLDDTGLSYELIFVDDGSSDQSFAVLKKLSELDGRLKVIGFLRNCGQTGALAAGIRGATGQYIITLDGDLQNDPVDIPLLLSEIEQGFDIVSGWRKNRQDGFGRSFVSRLANNLAARITGLELHDYGCSLKIYRAETLRKINLYGEMHRFLPLWAYLKGARVKEVVVQHHARKNGRSKYGYQRTLRVLLDMFLFYFLFHAACPLPFFAFFFFLFLSFFIFSTLVFFISQNLYLLFFASIFFCTALFSLLFGLILELILRTHYLSQNESQYIIRHIFNMETHPDYFVHRSACAKPLL